MSGTDASERPQSILHAIAEQAPVIDGWICPDCRHYAGRIHCRKKVFIAFTGANMKGCSLFEKERRER